MDLHTVLKEHFGYSSFRPGQQEVIEALLNGQDVLALLPTGMGKSLCYQLPGYVLHGTIIIISPLLSLMQDQVEQLKRLGEKRVIAINSFLNSSEKRTVLQYLDQYKFIFLSPEMLQQPYVQERLQQMRLSLVVIDEAHCISQWGFDFRPDYLRMGDWLQKEHRPPILALTATATAKVLQDIKMYLHMRTPFEFIHSVNRPNIHLGRLSFRLKEEKHTWMLEHIKATSGPGILYTQSRTRAKSISDALLGQGIRAAYYHGGMEQVDRQFIQQQFLEGHLEWIVATNAFGMGVHKSNIRQVIHDSMPSSIANYMQEIGRAGRDGEAALAILLYTEGDEELARFLVTDDLPTAHHVDLYAMYKERAENPSQMVQIGEISETAFRVLHYWMQALTAGDVKRKLEELRSEKLQAVRDMMEIVEEPLCMREALVNYFGQQLDKRPSHCCQFCGIDYNMIIDKRVEINEQSHVQSWEHRLAQLLLK